jgi:hemolysin III
MAACRHLPARNPRWFGFHEVFHALTIAAFTAHCAGITIALRSGWPSPP